MPFRFPFLCRCWSFQSRYSTGCQHQPTNQQTNKQPTKQQTNNNKQHQSPVLFKKTNTHTYNIYNIHMYGLLSNQKKTTKSVSNGDSGNQKKKTSPESHHNQKSQSHQQIVSKIRRWKSKVCSDAMLDLKVPSDVKTLPWDTWKSRVRGRSDVKSMVFDGLSDGQMSSVDVLFCVLFWWIWIF